MVIGGAGFIGSACVQQLLAGSDDAVTVYDNFSSGRRWHLEPGLTSGRLNVVEADVRDVDNLQRSMAGHEAVFHFASNPDIARAATEPTIDFDQGTRLTQNVVEASRQAGVRRVIYASGSGVFGDDPSKVFTEEDFSPRPTSTYAASKIAGEALLSAYCHMFGLTGVSFRFANVVGPHQTHGVAYDFIRRLRKNPQVLEVMGNGTQTKSYIHVDDVVRALVLFKHRQVAVYDLFNLSTSDALTVREIAEMVIAEMNLRDVKIVYGTTDKGWPGDVPRIRFSSAKIHAYGWQPRHNSREAMTLAIRGLLQNARTGRI